MISCGPFELVAHVRDQRLGLWEAMAEENAEQARLCQTDKVGRRLSYLKAVITLASERVEFGEDLKTWMARFVN